MKNERAIIFSAGILLGIGTVSFAKSKLGRKAAVAVVGKGLRLRECVAGIAAGTRETVCDIIAEAKSVADEKTEAQ